MSASPPIEPSYLTYAKDDCRCACVSFSYRPVTPVVIPMIRPTVLAISRRAAQQGAQWGIDKGRRKVERRGGENGECSLREDQ